VDLAQLSRGQGYVGWVYDNRRPVLIGDAQKDPLTAPVGDHTERSAVCVPLEAWGRVIGVLCLQNSTEYDAFQLRDVDLLYRVAGHAALTIQSTRVSAELYELGMRINRTDLSAEKIFRMVVQSIIKVCGAKAANMLLLRDTDDPALCLSQSPELGVSEGVPADFNQQTRPRPDGLTACALKTRHPCFVRNPDDAPGLNPLVTKHEIQACICLPLLLQDVIIGVLFVYYGEKHDFSKREIRILSLFANQTALAIQNAKQSERLKITASVVWMGIGFSTMAHRITQKTSAIKDAVYYLRRVLGDRGDIVERLSQIDLYAEALAGIPRAALLPLVEIPEPVDLSIILKQEIPRWCLGAAVVPDLMGLADGEILVNVDQKRLAFLLEILTTNAVRAMKDSALKMLRVSSVVRGGRVRVIMSDTGRPIPEEVRKILFKEPVPKPPGAEGTGVGLLIARSIVNSYGGEIDVLDTNPTETVFYFDLPTCRRTAEA
jgi:GAF domain-containing protein